MKSEDRSRRLRPRAAVIGAILLFCAGWAAFLVVLVRRAAATGDAPSEGLAQRLPSPQVPAALLAAAAAAEAPPAPPPAAAPRPRAVVVEHDDMSLPTATRHLVRATVGKDLPVAELRRLLDEIIDAERLDHPQLDTTSVYLYEEAVYARFTGRVTDLAAAVAHATWAPSGEWTQPARRLSGLDNRTVHYLPKR